MSGSFVGCGANYSSHHSTSIIHSSLKLSEENTPTQAIKILNCVWKTYVQQFPNTMEYK